MTKTKLWRRIEKEMDARGLVNKTLAARSRISLPVLSRMRHNTGKVSAMSLYRLSRAIGVGFVTLARLQSQSPPPVKYMDGKVSVICTICGKPGMSRHPQHNNYPHPKCRKIVQNRQSRRRLAEEKKPVANPILQANLALADFRTCLQCECDFESTGPGNRRCGKCTEVSERTQPHGGMYSVSREAHKEMSLA